MGIEEMTDQSLNEQVARKLGWKEPDIKTNPYVKGDLPKDVGRYAWERPDRVMTLKGVPDYCHSIEAAWEVVEYLGDRFNNISRHFDGPGYICTLDHGGITVGYKWEHWNGEADTAPMAIVKAFLKLPEEK